MTLNKGSLAFIVWLDCYLWFGPENISYPCSLFPLKMHALLLLFLSFSFKFIVLSLLAGCKIEPNETLFTLKKHQDWSHYLHTDSRVIFFLQLKLFFQGLFLYLDPGKSS